MSLPPRPTAHQPPSAPADAGSGNTAEPSWPLTTWQGWHRFALDLHQHKPSTLPRHAAYRHQCTAGRIGSFTRLIRQAAIIAIHDGTERITKTALDAVQLDHLAEQHKHPRTRTRTR